MQKYEQTNTPSGIKPGDYVRLRDEVTAPIGVVWDIHPKNVESVEVYYPVYGRTRMPKEYEPKDLDVVPAREVPEYLVKFKGTMGR